MTPHEHSHSQAPVDSSNSENDIIDDDMAAFVARMEDAFAFLKETRDTLLALHKAGDQEGLEEQLADITEEIASKNPDVQKNRALLKDLRSYSRPDKDAVDSIVADQKRIYSTIRGMVVHEAGLPDEVQFQAIELARQKVTEKLHEAYPNGIYTAEEALDTLGIATIDPETNKKIYHFPEELVTEKTNESWKTYLATVCIHQKAITDLEKNVAGSSQSAVQEADRIRTDAHNQVTREVHSTLNLQPNHRWEDLDTRNTLADIRNYLLPTAESALSPESNELVMKQLDHLAVLEAVHTPLSRKG